jgi:hypothetical protein
MAQSFTSVIRELKEVKAGQDIWDVVTAKRMNAIQSAIISLLKGDNVNSGPGIRKKTGDGWFTLSAAAGPDLAADTNIAFYLSFYGAEQKDDKIEYKVLIFDGKINGTFPDGMGQGKYILKLEKPEDSLFYVGVTFSPDTLKITSRFCGVSTAQNFPKSEVTKDKPKTPPGPPGTPPPVPPPGTPPKPDTFTGYLYWMIGFSYIDQKGVFKIVQTRLGDVNFELIYGANNAKPALLPVDVGIPWINLDAIFEAPPPTTP